MSAWPPYRVSYHGGGGHAVTVTVIERVRIPTAIDAHSVDEGGEGVEQVFGVRMAAAW